jgi:hypothetical protein
MRFLGFCLAALLAGCIDWHADRRTLVSTPIELGATPTVIRPNTPLRAVGPFNAVCLQVPDEYGLGAESAADRWKVRTPSGFVAPSVVLVDSVGQRTVFPVEGFSYGTEREICFETRPPRDLGRRYTTLELSADGPLRILRVRWEAGNRYASL